MKYSKISTIEPGMVFVMKGKVMLTCATGHVASRNALAHKVAVTALPGEGNKFLHDLDMAKPLTIAETAS